MTNLQQLNHGRWQLYEGAIEAAAGAELLRQAVRLEEDRSLASSVVLRVLETAPDEEQAEWIDHLPPESREHAARRGHEIRILRWARTGGLDVGQVRAGIDTWSNWL